MNLEKRLKEREGGKWNHDKWYAFGRSQNLTQMDGPKLIIQVLSINPRVIYDDRNLYMTGGGSGPFYGIRPKLDGINIFFLMGILNSKLFGNIIAKQSTPMRGGYIKFSKQYIEDFPICEIENSKKEKELHSKVVSLVKQIIDLHKKVKKAKVSHEKEIMDRQIKITNDQIDRLVFELYGLTDKEIDLIDQGL